MLRELPILKELGFSDKDISVYRSLLGQGTASVRQLASKTGINRGSVYESLKKLLGHGLVSYHQQGRQKTFFIENPKRIRELVWTEERRLKELKKRLYHLVPQLQAIYNIGGHKPVVRYLEGDGGVKTLLQDVLEVSSKEKERFYRVYSSRGIRKALYHGFPEFTQERVRCGVSVRVIALGKGGSPAPKSERRWLVRNLKGAPTYQIIYGDKLGFISLDSDDNQMVVMIHDQALAKTQALIFDALWREVK